MRVSNSTHDDMINKGQVEGVSKKDVLEQKKFVESLFGIAV